jgi:hypothetical protein
MSSSSRPEGPEAPWRIGKGRAQTEPIAALVAVLAIAIGLGLYAGVAADHRVEEDGTDAEATMQRVSGAVLEDGVFADPGDRSLDPERFARPGERVRIELRWDGDRWSIGRRAPPEADAAWRPVTIQTADRQVPGRLIVRVWER